MNIYKRENTLVVFALLAFYVLLVIRNAWISDDAIITFRAVENFVAGYGLGYNPFVRVQVFTHPLWMLLLSTIYFVVGLIFPSVPNALFYINFLLSIALSALTAYLFLVKISKPRLLMLGLSILILSLSNAFMDFSTSGLENPLTHFLLVLFVIVYLSEKPNLLWLSLLSSLIMLNRLDAILLIAPALLYLLWMSPVRKSDILKTLLGLLPIALWELFSLLYFGFAFPNTAYAKLSTSVSDNLLILQGLDYFLNVINWDPLTPFIILLAGVALYLERNSNLLFLYIGILLYLAYIVKIGGDFMAGRFFAAPLLLSVVILSNQLVAKRVQIASLAIVILFGVFSLRSSLWSSNMTLYFPTYPISDRNDISDQRMHYFGNFRKDQFNSFAESGFHEEEWGSQFAGNNWEFTGYTSVYVADALGRPGYKKSPNTYVIDSFALSDPLLARLPAIEWEIGHFRREIPEGYLETLESGENQIADPNLSLYYSKLQVLISDPIWDWNRITEIWKFNTGQYDYLLDLYNARTSN